MMNKIIPISKKAQKKLRLARYPALGASKTNSDPIVHLAQIMHISCTNTNTVSKRTEMRFHITHVT
jgi:hypothetical protein